MPTRWVRAHRDIEPWARKGRVRTRKTSPLVCPVDCLRLLSPWLERGRDSAGRGRRQPRAPTRRAAKEEASVLRFSPHRRHFRSRFSVGRVGAWPASVPSKLERALGPLTFMPEQPPERQGRWLRPASPGVRFAAPSSRPAPRPAPSVCVCTSQPSVPTSPLRFSVPAEPALCLSLPH